MRMKEFIGSAWCLLLVILTIGGCVKKHEPISLNYISLQRVEHPTQGGPEGLFHVYEVKFSTSADLKGVFDHPYDWLPNLFCVVSSPERQYRVADIPEGRWGFTLKGLCSILIANLEATEILELRMAFIARRFFLSGNFSSAVNIDSALSELKDAEQEGGAMLCQVVISGGNLSVPGESSFIGTLKWLQTRPFYSETMTFPISELMK